MKKTTIALLTAAAIGGSSLAIAAEVTGPDVFGRIEFQATDTDTTDVAFSNSDSKLGVTGGATGLFGGVDGYYSARIDLVSGQDSAPTAADDKEFNTYYTYVGIKGAFGDFRFGEDDNLVYKFAGVHTDIIRELDPGSDAYAAYSDLVDFDATSAQYHYTFENITVAAFADTNGDGINNVQFGASADFGPATVGLVHADDGADGEDSEIWAGGSLDLGVASLRATVGDQRDGTNPYVLGAVVPINDVFTGTLAYGNDDNAANDSDVVAQIRANLGGGLEWNASIRNGDADNGVGTSLRFTF